MRARISIMQARNINPAFQAVIFDLDGTLADTLPTVVRIFNQVTLRHAGRHYTLPELLPYFGPPEDAIFQKLIVDDTKAAAAIADYYRLCQEDGAEIAAFPGIPELLADLRNAGVRLGVFTGATTRAGRIRLSHAGLLDFFEEILGSEGLSNYKPHPEGVHKLLEQFGVGPQNALFIGDSPFDVAAGRSAGVTTAGVLWGAGTAETLTAAQAHHLVEEPQQLRALFD
jgi:HAD superfamily hydrolase (TIGR01549 family)